MTAARYRLVAVGGVIMVLMFQLPTVQQGTPSNRQAQALTSQVMQQTPTTAKQYHLQIITPPASSDKWIVRLDPPKWTRKSMPILQPRGTLGTDRTPATR